MPAGGALMSARARGFVPRRFVVGRVRRPASAAGGDRARCARGAQEPGHPHAVPGPRHRGGAGTQAAEDPDHRPVRRRSPGACIAYSMIVLHEHDRLADQHRQPAAPQPARVHPHHLRAGGAAGRRVVLLRFLAPGASCPSPYHPVFESGDFARASIDAFFLSVEVAAGDDPATSPTTRARGRRRDVAEVVAESER